MLWSDIGFPDKVVTVCFVDYVNCVKYLQLVHVHLDWMDEGNSLDIDGNVYINVHHEGHILLLCPVWTFLML